MTEQSAESGERVNSEIREAISDHVQELATMIDPGSLVTGWTLVFSVASDESPDRGGFAIESALGQGLHVDLGLLEMGCMLTRARALN